MPKSYILPAEAREELLRYLGNKPYREVASGMLALINLQPFEEDEAPPGEVSDARTEQGSADG